MCIGMKLVPESLNEFYRKGDYSDEHEHVKDVLDIGDRKVRDESKLRRFAEVNGYEFIKDPKRGTLRINVPMEFEEPHDYASTGQIWGDRGRFSVDTVQYTITYPTGGWEETPISVRKRWMSGGRGMKQSLMDRFASIEDAIIRIEKSIPKERRKAQRG